MKKIKDIGDVYSAEQVGYADVVKAVAVHRTEDKFPVTNRGRELLQRSEACYAGLREIRERRKRSRRYYRGDQWQDKITVHKDGRDITMTEEEYIQMQGKPALKQNLIRPPVRNIIGQFRSNVTKSVIYSRNRKDNKAAEMMSVAYEAAYEINDGKYRDARMLEEFLLSGFPIYDTSYSWDTVRQKPIPKFRKVEVPRFFVNPTVNDVCGDDVDIVGELVDVSLDEVVSTYAKNEFEEEEIRRIYGNHRVTNAEQLALTADNVDNISFYVPSATDTCRIIKVCVLEGRWLIDAHDYADGTRTLYEYSKKEDLDRENIDRLDLEAKTGVVIPKIKYRKKYVREWVYYHLSPWGHVLFRKVNPYKHKSHPYVFCMYPLLDGEVWSLVEDLIDQQRAINRLFIQQDFVIGASAKGVLLVPEEAIPDDFDLEDIADEWTRYNGVIKIRTRNGIQMPQQISASNFNIGINDQINFQIKWMQEIGGVQDAAYGVSAKSGTSASRYKAETINSSLNILDYLDSFGHMLTKRDWKIIQIIKQYYTDKQYIALAGDEYSDEAHNYDPDAIRDLDFDNTIAKTEDNYTMRFISEDSLMKLLEMRLIDLRQYLEASETPYSAKLLKKFDEAQQAAQNGNLSQEQLNGLMQGIQQETPASTPQGLNNVKGLFNQTLL